MKVQHSTSVVHSKLLGVLLIEGLILLQLSTVLPVLIKRPQSKGLLLELDIYICNQGLEMNGYNDTYCTASLLSLHEQQMLIFTSIYKCSHVVWLQMMSPYVAGSGV